MSELNKVAGKLTFNQRIFLVLILIIPFVMSASDVDYGSRMSISILPGFVKTITSSLRWIILIYITLFSAHKLLLNGKLDKFIFILSLFYAVQLIMSLIFMSDIVRYSGLFLLSISIPYYVSTIFKTNLAKLLKYTNFIIYFQVLLSFFLGYGILTNQHRFMGFLNNPNLYGMVAIFWLCLLLLSLKNLHSKSQRFFNTAFISIIIFSIILSGSRAALAGLVIIFLFFVFRSKMKVSFWNIFILISILLLISSSHLFIPEIRSFNVDEVRYYAWSTSIDYIKDNPFGYGMNAPTTLEGFGNIHNCYIRFALMMGVVPTIIAFSFYVAMLIKFFREWRIPFSLIAAVFSFTLMNYAEDYFVGIGSSVIPYFMVIFGIAVFYSHNPHQLSSRS